MYVYGFKYAYMYSTHIHNTPLGPLEFDYTNIQYLTDFIDTQPISNLKAYTRKKSRIFLTNKSLILCYWSDHRLGRCTLGDVLKWATIHEIPAF